MGDITQEKINRAAAAINTSKKILAAYKTNREISAGCKAQMLKDIAESQSPERIILTAAECISRLCNSGDSFYNEVKTALEKHSAGALAADPETQEGAEL